MVNNKNKASVSIAASSREASKMSHPPAGFTVTRRWDHQLRAFAAQGSCPDHFHLKLVIASQKVLPTYGLGIPPCGFWSFLHPFSPIWLTHLSTQPRWVMTRASWQYHWADFFFLLLALAIKGAFLNSIWSGSLSSETLKYLSPSPWVCSYDLDRTFSLLLSEWLQSGHNSSSVLQDAKEGQEGTVGERKQISSLCWKNSSSNFYIHTPLTFVAAWARDS